MPKAKLTDLYIQKLPPASNITHYDQLLPAFGVRVGKTRKTFLVIDTRGRRTSIGHYPKTSLADARKRARELLAPEGTFIVSEPLQEVWRAYLAAHITPNYKPKSAYRLTSLVDKYCDELMVKPIRDIRTGDITALYAHMPQSQANHLFVTLRGFFNWAVRNDHVDTSPMAKLKKPYKDVSRSRVLTDDEIRAIWIASDHLGSFGMVVKLCLLLGLRRTEAASIQKQWLAAETLLLPASITKNKHELSLPLSPYSTKLIKTFCEHTTTPLRNWHKPKLALDKASGVTDWVLHDLRRTFATKLAFCRVPIDVIESLLNHITGSRNALQRTYDRYDRMQEKREALAQWEAHLLKIVSPKG